MKFLNLTLFVAMLCFQASAFAYGSSSSKKACTKPKFSEFTPPHLSVIAQNNAFSFKASSITNPDTLQVTVKGEKIPVQIDSKGSAFVVSGKLPPEINDDFVRIGISASSKKKCKTKDGWLLKLK